jgi:MATE family, multidrug efflux pump
MPASPALVRQLVGHAWPVLVAQLSSMAMMVADTLIAGRYATTDLAAVAIGSSVYISVVMLLVGILQALAPVVAHHVGAGRRDALAPALQQGFWLAALLGLPGVLLLRFPDPLLAFSGASPEVDRLARSYLATVAAGLPAVLLYRTFYAFTNAMGKPRALMAISLVSTLVHLPLAWALTYGRLGWPPLGALGCALSTACVGWFALACGLVFLHRHAGYRSLGLFARWHPPRRADLAELLRLGLPMGFSTFVEITSFTFIALLVARLGADVVAGHRIVANLGALAYMLPLSLSVATLVLVGQATGAGNPARARATIRAALFLAAGLSTLLGMLLWSLRDPIIAAHTLDPAVRQVALTLVIYICVYQLVDAIQTVASHSLRGYKVTFLPMLVHTACFWGIGLGGGWWLAYRGWPASPPLGAAGFWQAAVLATVAAALAFSALLAWVMRHKGSLTRAAGPVAP